MSSATGRGPGRPSKPDPETMRKAREYLDLHTNLDASVEKIAKRDNVTPTWVHELIRRARAEVAAEEAADTTPSTPAEPKLQPLRRLSRRVAQSRAWDIADRRPTFALGLGANSLWVRTVVAIHEDGDGFRLGIGEEGARFRSRDDLAVLLLGHLERQDVDVNGWLKALFEHGRLIDVGGVDVGIPRGLGLIPGENARGEPLKAAPVKKTAGTEAPPLPFRPMVVSGGRADSREIPPFDSREIPISVESDSRETPPETQVKSPISLDSDGASNVTPSPSLTSYPSFQPIDQSVESEEGSERERASARPGADPLTQVKLPISVESDSRETPPATQVKSPISVESASPARSITPGRTPIPDDWQPTAGAIKEMAERGFDDPGLIAEKYRAWCLRDDIRSNDHHAGFRLFYLKERPPHQATPPGSGPQQKPPGNGFDALVLRDGFAGGYGGAKRPVDGKAEPNPVLDYLASEEAKKNAG